MTRATFRAPEILYIIRGNCCTSQGDPDSSFPYITTRHFRNPPPQSLNPALPSGIINSMIKLKQSFIRNGIETIFADLNTQGDIITVVLVFKWSVDISTENFSIALEKIISSLYPIIITYIMGDLKINLLDFSTSSPAENFLI